MYGPVHSIWALARLSIEITFAHRDPIFGWRKSGMEISSEENGRSSSPTVGGRTDMVLSLRNAAEKFGIGMAFQVQMLKELLEGQSLMVPETTTTGSIKYSRLPISPDMISDCGTKVYFAGEEYPISYVVPDRDTQLKALKLTADFAGTTTRMALATEKHLRDMMRQEGANAVKTSITLNAPKRKTLAEVQDV